MTYFDKKRKRNIYLLVLFFLGMLSRAQEDAFTVAFYLNFETGFMCIRFCIGQTSAKQQQQQQ